MQKGGESACVEGFVDSGAGTTLWDVSTAERCGLGLVRPQPHQSFGIYWGAGGDKMHYAGMIPGPITVTWAPGLEFTIPCLMVIDTRAPLVLWGTDVMKCVTNKWAFCSLGYNDHGTGVLLFK